MSEVNIENIKEQILREWLKLFLNVWYGGSNGKGRSKNSG